MNTFMASLFSYGNGIYRLAELDQREIGHVVDDVVARFPGVFASDIEARQRLVDFQTEVEHTRTAFFGIEHRWAVLEKSCQRVEQRLIQWLRDHGKDATAVFRLLWGDKSVAPELRLPGEHLVILNLASLSAVREGAQLLKGLEPAELFSPGSGLENCCFDYSQWRRCYFDAATHGEELLVGVS